MLPLDFTLSFSYGFQILATATPTVVVTLVELYSSSGKVRGSLK